MILLYLNERIKTLQNDFQVFLIKKGFIELIHLDSFLLLTWH